MPLLCSGAALAGTLLETYEIVMIGFVTAPLVILAGAVLLRLFGRADLGVRT